MNKCDYTKFQEHNDCYYRGNCPFIKSPGRGYPLGNSGQNYFMTDNCREDFQYRTNEKSKQPIITFEAVDLRELQE